MDGLKQFSLATVSAATKNFDAAGKIGEGATGEVFKGVFEDVPIAAKCLKLPHTATPEARAELRHRFEVELGTLKRFQHARIVKILGFAMGDTACAPFPLVLIFELLEAGSLADWLQGFDGGAAVRGILTAIERVDIALGAGAGLAYLHGLTDEAEGGVAVGGGDAGPLVLHRDVKSANIGLTRLTKGGPLSPKILDCGLAKAIRGADGAAAVGVSFTGGLVAGTAGYMAPEVADGTYTLKSEV